MKFFGTEKNLFITDVDGVLLDLMACLPKNFLDAAIEFGVSTEPIKQYFLDVGAGLTKGFASVSATIKMLYPELNDIEIQKFKKMFHQKDAQNPYPPVDGSRIMIKWLAKHIKVAICTTKSRSDLMHHLQFAGYDINWFSFISSWETGHPKPDPRALTIINDALNIPKEKSLFAGDWFPDWQCAKSAGIDFCAVLSGGIPKHAFMREGIPEDHIFERLFDITQIVKP